MARPNSARLLASVAPDVKMISSASAPISAPTAAMVWMTIRAQFEWLQFGQPRDLEEVRAR